MRLAPSLLATVIGCGPSARALDRDACAGLECRVVPCANQGRPETTISGTVFAPNGTLPLFGVTVYIPNDTPAPLVDGVTCTRCGAAVPDGAVAHAVSDETGHFTVTNVPSGKDIPLVIQIGKWRRQIALASVPDCTNTVVDPEQSSLPRSQDQGDLPKIAIVTGGCDALECLLRKIGVADSEFTPDSGTGRIHMYTSNGANTLLDNVPFAPAATLWGSLDKLKQYDLAMFSCECSQRADEKPQAMMDNVKAYADAGGRVFLSHYQNVWIAGETDHPSHAPAVWPTIATCTSDMLANDDGVIDQIDNPNGFAFASWMSNVMASTGGGVFPIENGRQTCTSVDPTKGEQWVYLQGTTLPQTFQFTTPNEQPIDARCGKVAFSDVHVAAASTSVPNEPFPSGCSNTVMTPQEKVLAFMMFDLASCVGPIF